MREILKGKCSGVGERKQLAVFLTYDFKRVSDDTDGH